MSRSLLLLLLAISWPALLCAEQANHLEQLLQQIQKSQKQESITRQARENRFLSEHADQKKLLAEIKARLTSERKRSQQLRTTFDDNEKVLIDLEAELKRQTGDLGEVFGTVRQSAKDISVLINESLVSAQYPGRAEWLQTLGESKKLPGINELEKLWHLTQQETIESGRVISFPSTVIDTNGEASKQQVVRVGLFNALMQGLYLSYQPETNRFVVLVRQPSQVEDQLAAYLGITSKTEGSLAIDPTRGVLLGLLVDTPEPLERISQGGIVGYIILALGGLGFIIVIVRLIYLTITGQAIRKQLNNPATPCKKNPLGRILTVAANNTHADLGHLELQIDEAILRELPTLTQGEGLLKLLAGVAPLLGLLGTVVGMIATFQSITLFGTGDPKMMADGISQALVTTALGLIVAIPLLFMHTLITSRSQALVQILDEQSLGLIAAGKEGSNA